MTNSPESQTPDRLEPPSKKGSKITAQIAICSFLFLLLFYGFCIGGLVLKEPDICFLLGGGRWIVEHGHLPATDPFSYTTHFHPVPYVIEKWLTEVVFYGIEKSLGLTALLIFDGLILALAFVIVPYRIVHLCGIKGGAAMRMVCLSLLASMSHLAVRPEIFSFLFTALWFEIIVRINSATRGNTKIRWDLIAVLMVLMCLWSNMHTLFMVGVLIPGFYSACALVERFIPSTKDKPFNWTMPIATIACLLASLINPYGIGLWTYLPNVFGSFNDTNNEMQPINLKNAANPFFLGYYLLVITGLIELAKSLKKPLSQGDLFFRGLIPLGIFGGFKTVRSIPMSGLFLFSGRANLHPKSANNAEPIQEKIPEKIQEKNAGEGVMESLTNPFLPIWPITCIATVCIGVFACTTAVEPIVPQDSAAFKPPFEAIEFIEKAKPKGNLLNDPHFGAVMIYKMHDNPPVFIDPRYNLYGNTLLQDYWHMVNCDANYNELLSKYKIDWIFLAPNTKLPQELAKSTDWRLLYSDKKSVIYARNNAIQN
ncbi:MAG: hypothetical protein IT343_10965 [Candidatus Melainabacteria bacterium]|nr:hypothetical protein [Candidatus Melainabacteria bacterium]